MTAAVAPETMKAALQECREELLQGPTLWSVEDLLGFIDDLCIKLKTPYDQLPLRLIGLREEVRAKRGRVPEATFDKIPLIAVFDGILRQS